MALFRNTGLLVLKRAQSVPAVLYHQNVSYYYYLLSNLLLIEWLSKNTLFVQVFLQHAVITIILSIS